MSRLASGLTFVTSENTVREALKDTCSYLAKTGDLRVGVVGSGGLWHTPGTKNAYLNEEFDGETLAFLKAGDGRGMAEHFDAYRVPEGEAPVHLSVSWWGEMPLGAHLREFLWLPRVAASVHFGDDPQPAADRKELTAQLHAAVAKNFEPMVATAEVERLMRLKAEDPQQLPRVLQKRADRFQ